MLQNRCQEADHLLRRVGFGPASLCLVSLVHYTLTATPGCA